MADDDRRIADSDELPSVSVIIPAFNEAGYIAETLDRLNSAQDRFKAVTGATVQVLVVDNASSDPTAALAREAGARILFEGERNIARVRNVGAAAALHDVLIFLDADTLVPPELLLHVAQAMVDPRCAGGAIDAVHQPDRILLQVYLQMWRVLGIIGGMAQGACQFCRRSVFGELGGYDETWYMGEDVDFYWRLKRLARRRGLRVSFIREIQVVPSPRRFER